jgi:hypothetical protein
VGAAGAGAAGARPGRRSPRCLTGNVNLPRFDNPLPDHQPALCVRNDDLETIPAPKALISSRRRGACAEWAARLPPGPRVGLVWAGEPRGYDPAAQALDRRRSLPFKMLLARLTVTSQACRSSACRWAPARSQIPPGIHDPMGGVKDFADTAAIVASLDLVISVDTAVAHLAGAMGKPVFLLDRYDNCWRWLQRPGRHPMVFGAAYLPADADGRLGAGNRRGRR